MCWELKKYSCPLTICYGAFKNLLLYFIFWMKYRKIYIFLKEYFIKSIFFCILIIKFCVNLFIVYTSALPCTWSTCLFWKVYVYSCNYLKLKYLFTNMQCFCFKNMELVHLNFWFLFLNMYTVCPLKFHSLHFITNFRIVKAGFSIQI